MRLDQAIRHSRDNAGLCKEPEFLVDIEFYRESMPHDRFRWAYHFDELQRLDEGRWKFCESWRWHTDDVEATDWKCTDGWHPDEDLAIDALRREVNRLRAAVEFAACWMVRDVTPEGDRAYRDLLAMTEGPV